MNDQDKTRIQALAELAEVRASEKRYHSLFDQALDMIHIVDTEGRIIDANAAELSRLGYTRDEVVGRPVLDLVHPDHRPVVRAHLSRVLAGKAVPQYESALVTKSGEKVDVEINASSRVEGGRVVSARAIIRDITERIRADEEREERERYLRSLMYSLHEDILVIDRNFRVTDINNTALVTTGQTRDEAVGRFCYEVSHDYHAPCAEMGESCALGEVFATGEARSCHHIHRATDGSEVHVDIRLSPLTDAEGRVTQVIEAARDVTSLVEAGAELKASEERYGCLVESMTEGILVVDENGVLTFVNRAFCSMLGYPSGGLVGHPLTELLDDENSTIVRTQLAGRRVGEDNSYHLAFTHHDGHQIHTIVSPAGFFDDDGPFADSFAVITDITERRQLEQQLAQAQKLEALGQLAGGIAHDFNNLLMAISGSADLLGMQASELAEDSQELATIRNTVQRGAALTRRLLTIARQQVLQMEILDLDHVVADEIEILRRVIPESIAMDFRPAGDLPALRADRGQLAQVLMNLVVNARDAMADGGTITIETGTKQGPPVGGATERTGDGPFVRLAVSDTGEGMDAATLVRVFDPFFSTKAPEQGTGLGLATVYGIVRQHGGMIEVQSAPGEGARFDICLPAVSEVAEEGREAGEREMVGGSETVLVVEDDPVVRRTVVQMLGGLNYAVLEAEDGEEALALIEGGAAVDLMLSDVVMPRMGGKKLLERARKLTPGLAFLFSSGYTNKDLRNVLAATERTSFITKPFTVAQLATAVREALGNTE